MKKLFLGLLLNLFGLIAINAQTGNAGKSLLWKVSGNGLERPSYLFGTFHMLCEKDFLIRPKVVKALKETKLLCQELNYADTAELAALQKITVSSEKLSDKLEPEKYRALDTILKGMGYSLPQVDNMALPGVLSLMLMATMDCAPSGLKMYEIELLKMAKDHDMIVSGLETVEEQAALLNLVGIDGILKQFAPEANYKGVMDKMIGHYKNEDLELLARLVTDTAQMTAATHEAMLEKRNRNWVLKMPGIMQQQSAFFAVGAAHLWGNEGIITLLRKNGFTITPVMD